LQFYILNVRPKLHHDSDCVTGSDENYASHCQQKKQARVIFGMQFERR